MKKGIALGLALALAASVGTTAFAADVNPFTDVPAAHWSYSAVQQLAKDGIVDGYTDGQFKGDKTMTRYEMAVIVAKALAKEDTATASQKVLIDKLAAEFATELGDLGVRVNHLEKNSTTPFGPSAKVYGDTRIRYLNDYNRYDTNENIAPSSRDQERFRLNFDANIANNVFMQSRLTFQSSVNAAGDTLPGGVSNQSTGIVDYAFIQFNNVENTGADFRLGRDFIWSGYGLISGNTGGYDEAKLIFNSGKKVKASLAYGDIAPYILYDSSGSQAGVAGVGTGIGNVNTNPNSGMNKYTGQASSPAVDVTTANVTWNPNTNFQLISDLYWSNTLNYNYKVYSFGIKTNITPNLYFAGDYAHNTSDNNIFMGSGYSSGSTAGAAAQLPSGTPSNDQKSAYFAQLGYTHGANNTNNGIDSANPGAWGLFANYKHLGGQAVDWNNTSILVFESITDPFLFTEGEKGMGYGVQYVPVKNVRLSGTYETMTSLDGSIKRAPFTYVRAEYNF